MKKTLFALSAMVVGLASYGQGYFYDTSTIHIFYNTNAAYTTSLDTAFLIAPNGDTPAIESTANGVPTAGGTISSSQATADWNAILTDSNFSFATNNNTGNIVVGTTSAANGSGSYNGGVDFPVTGTASGTTYEVFVISWSSAYSTPQAAAAANANLGWSKAFTYTDGSLASPPTGGFSTASASPSITAFGEYTVVSTPEPSTIALAGLGVSALVAFRRRNSSK